MSLPRNAQVGVKVSLPAADALRLAKKILRILSRVGDLQEELKKGGEPIRLINTEPGALLLELLGDIQVTLGVNIEILPDLYILGTSGYGYYTAPKPGDEVYVPKVNV